MNNSNELVGVFYPPTIPPYMIMLGFKARCKIVY
jgi:hypothetical protein